ncbi:MAG: spondin domain-containing protein [Acidobacteria bacterium]|nr:spondin domain-containing protein [Acidobacteriota bacterium]
MKRWTITGVLFAAAMHAAGADVYEVTITNLTRGQRFTPVLVASHKKGVRLFDLGTPASPQLKTIAEEGDPGPLAALLRANPDVKEVVISPAPPPVSNLVAPGATITLMVHAGGQFDHFSVAAMLIPTNDAFFALNGAEGPKGNESLLLLSPAYDAGTERNDETCASIPGPGFAECVTPANPGGNGGGGAPGGGEGYVHIHAGIHGIGNFNAAMRDWRNPVAKITIRRIHSHD